MNYNIYNYNKKNELYKEFETLKNKYIKKYKEKQSLQNFFSDKFTILDKRNNKQYKINNNIENYIFEYFNTILQRVMYNKEIGKKEKLVPYFITFTLPSEYHPFINFKNGKQLKNKIINPKFEFETIEESASQSYKKLVEIFRSFYKQLKDNRKYRKEMKGLKYNYFIEYHKSFIPHLHLLVYVPNVPNVDEYVERIYHNTIKKNKLNEKGNKLIKIESKGKLGGLDGAVLYISKYITKTIENIKKDKKNLQLYWGWKSYNNIRIFRGNNTKIGIKGYKKIYYSLDEKEKENLLKKVKKNRSCLLSEIEKISVRYSSVVNEVGEVETKIKKGLKSKDNKIKYEIKEYKQKTIIKKYKKIYQLFSIVKDIQSLNNLNNLPIWYYLPTYKSNLEKENLNVLNDEISNDKDKYFNGVYQFINEKIILNRLKDKVNLSWKKIQKYFNIFKEYIENYEKPNYQKMDNIVLSLKHKEHIIKRIIKGLYEVIDDETKRNDIKSKLLSKDDDRQFYKGLLIDLKSKLKMFISIFKSVKITTLFFKVKYELLSYEIYKDNVKIYDKNDFSIVPINEE